MEQGESLPNKNQINPDQAPITDFMPAAIEPNTISQPGLDPNVSPLKLTDTDRVTVLGNPESPIGAVAPVTHRGEEATSDAANERLKSVLMIRKLGNLVVTATKKFSDISKNGLKVTQEKGQDTKDALELAVTGLRKTITLKQLQRTKSSSEKHITRSAIHKEVAKAVAGNWVNIDEETERKERWLPPKEIKRREMERSPRLPDPALRPTALSERRTAMRTSRRKTKMNTQRYEKMRLEKIYGKDLGTDAHNDRFKSERHTLSEKKAHISAGVKHQHAVNTMKRKSTRIEKTKVGEGIVGRRSSNRALVKRRQVGKFVERIEKLEVREREQRQRHEERLAERKSKKDKNNAAKT